MKVPIIGQTALLDYILKVGNNLPHFIVLVGRKGSGKRRIAEVIAETLGCVYSETDISVQNVREVIDTAYTSATRVLYCFADADTMRAEAKNAMLKITEEPPVNAYFVLTVQDESSLLDTVKSRADVLRMFPYSNSDIRTYVEAHETTLSKSDLDILIPTCYTPGDVDMLMGYNIQEFYDYVKLVYDNIVEVEPANAFKSSLKLAIKTEDGYDLGLFWQMFLYIAMLDLIHNTDEHKNGCMITVTNIYLNKLQKVGVNKQQLYDGWVFDIREVCL